MSDYEMADVGWQSDPKEMEIISENVDGELVIPDTTKSDLTPTEMVADTLSSAYGYIKELTKDKKFKDLNAEEFERFSKLITGNALALQKLGLNNDIDEHDKYKRFIEIASMGK